MHTRSRFESFCARTGCLSRQPDACNSKAEDDANKSKNSYVKVASHSASRKVANSSYTFLLHKFEKRDTH